MAHDEPPSLQHQVGITNAQEDNPDEVIADLTRRMNAQFAAGDYGEAIKTAFTITPLSKDELRETFERYGVKVLHLNHEAVGIYGGVIEPSYDLRVDGETPLVLAAAKEFGNRHLQEAVLIARKIREGENDPAERLGFTIRLQVAISAEEAMLIAALVKANGFKGATFMPNRGEVAIYDTDDLGMSNEQFKKAANLVADRIKSMYALAEYTVELYFIMMPKL